MKYYDIKKWKTTREYSSDSKERAQGKGIVSYLPNRIAF